jgi:hypothetical protein
MDCCPAAAGAYIPLLGGLLVSFYVATLSVKPSHFQADLLSNTKPYIHI